MNAPGRPEPDSRINRPWVHWMDEYGMMLYFLSYPTLVVLNDALGGDGWFWLVIPFAILFMGAYLVATDRHQPGLCPSCFKAFPADPGGVAQGRALPWLYLNHLVCSTGLLVQCLVRIGSLARVLTITLWCLVPLLLLSTFVPYPWGFWVGMASVCVPIHAGRRHYQLRDYCPRCGNNGGGGGGGDAEDVPDPDPAPGKQVRA